MTLDQVSMQSIRAWLVEDYAVPLVSLEFAFSGGASQDPSGKAGAATMLVAALDAGEGRRRLRQAHESGQALQRLAPGEDGEDGEAAYRHAYPDAAARYGLNGDADVFAISPGLFGSRGVGRLTVRDLSAAGPAAVELESGFLSEQADVDALVEALQAHALGRAAGAPDLAHRDADDLIGRGHHQ